MKRSAILRKPRDPSITVKVKPARCRAPGCRNEFERRSMTHIACSTDCAKVIAERKREKAEALAEKVQRAVDRQKRERMKSRTDLIKEAQQLFNKFIRLRDVGKPCICCGRVGESSSTVGGGAFDAGHYRSTGSAPHLRFHEDNCHAQLKHCNRYGAGRAVDYRIGLTARIGIAAVEALEADQSSPKWTTDDLRVIREIYRAKVHELEKAAA